VRTSWCGQIVVSVIAVLLSAVSLAAQFGAPTATVTPLVEHATVAAGSEVRAALQVQLPDKYHTNSNKPRDPLLIPLTVTFDPLPEGVRVKGVVFPEAKDFLQPALGQTLSVFEGTFAIATAFAIGSDVKSGPLEVRAAMRYQACDESTCYPPKTVATAWTLAVGAGKSARQHAAVFDAVPSGRGDAPTIADKPYAAPVIPARTPAVSRDAAAALDAFVEKGTATGYLGADDFMTFIKNAEAGVRPRGMFEGQGPIAILLLVLLGGLALNLTPCVLPMIPINLAIIGAGAQAGSRSRGFVLGASYGAAMALVYGVLGLIVVLTASTFGTITSYWWFNAGIALLFLVLALAMFDVISIDFSRYSDRFKVSESGRGSVLVAFTMGGIAALLAGACVAPVVIQVVLFSSDLYAKGTAAALALPFLLGVGMAIPWPIAGAGLSRLPKPGPWMVRVKQAFGVLILGTAIYYGYLSYGLFADRFVDAAEVSSSVEAKLKEGWHASLAEGLAAAEREGKPVLIDLWATWCKNCLTMDKTTLASGEVTEALSGYVKIKYQAEQPDASPAAEVMKRFKAVGLPAYAILKPASPAGN
jgi:thiol:disulfide interchange protein DsbD